MQSIEGMVPIGYVVLTIILTYIISQLWYDREGKITGSGILGIMLLLQFIVAALIIFFGPFFGTSPMFATILGLNALIGLFAVCGIGCVGEGRTKYGGWHPEAIVFKKTVQKYKKIEHKYIADTSSSPQDMLDTARKFVAEGNLYSAENAYRKLIRKYPNYLTGYYELAEILHKMDRHSEAEEVLQKAGDDSVEFGLNDIGS